MKRAGLLLLLACAPQGHWPPQPAEHPPTRAELAVYELTVLAPSREERDAFARALAERGFDVVDHPPMHQALEVKLTHEGASLVATLRSDGLFVDEALGPDVGVLARTLSLSQRVADFIRNRGLPQQRSIPETLTVVPGHERSSAGAWSARIPAP